MLKDLKFKTVDTARDFFGTHLGFWFMFEPHKDRINTGSDHGRVIRKLINSNLFADKMAILSNNPIPSSVRGFTRPFMTSLNHCQFWQTGWDSGKRVSVKPWLAHRHLNVGDKIAFYENEEIREGSFLCAFDKIDPSYILGDVLNNEDDLKYFCISKNINMKNIFT